MKSEINKELAINLLTSLFGYLPCFLFLLFSINVYSLKLLTSKNMPVTVKFYLRILKEQVSWVQSNSYFQNKTDFNLILISKKCQKYPVFHLRQIKSKDLICMLWTILQKEFSGCKGCPSISNNINVRSNILYPYVFLTLNSKLRYFNGTFIKLSKLRSTVNFTDLGRHIHASHAVFTVLLLVLAAPVTFQIVWMTQCLCLSMKSKQVKQLLWELT